MSQSAEGADKVAAAKAGLAVEEYQARRSAGLKKCTRCRAWKPVGGFDADSSRHDGRTAACSICRRVKVKRERIAFPSDDKKSVQRAHDAIRWAVKRGFMPKPTVYDCDCGDPAVHYHHHRGYALEHVLDVVAKCSTCHQKAHWK